MIANNSGQPAVLQQLSTPLTVPALSAGSLPGSKDGSLTANGIDGLSTMYKAVGNVALVPGLGAPALLCDLATSVDLAQSEDVSASTLQVWLAHDAAARERRVVADLRASGVTVVHRDSIADRRRALGRSAPAWSMQLALAAGALTVPVAVLLLCVAESASRASRRRDTAALAVVGVPRAALRRATLVEFLVTVVTATVVGAVVGLVGARLAFPAVPIFVQDVDVPDVLRPTAWLTFAGATGAVLRVLSVSAVILAESGRPRPERRPR